MQCKVPHSCVLEMVVQDLMQTGEEPSIGATFERSPIPSFADLELWRFETEDDLKVSCRCLFHSGMALRRTGYHCLVNPSC